MATTSSKSEKETLPESFSILNYDYRIGSVCDAVFPKNVDKKSKRTSLAKLFNKCNKSNKIVIKFLEPPPSKYDNMSPEQLKKEAAKESTQQQSDKNSTKKSSKSDNERNKRTIFVGNLPLHCKAKDLKKLFSRYGTIESIRFRSVPIAESNLSKKTAFIKKKFHNKGQSMNAYVVFETEKAAQDATESNGVEFLNHHIRVDLAINSNQHDHKRSVFVGNLPNDIKVESLRTHFLSCGEIETVRIIRDSKTGIGKGFGFVTFKSSDSLIMALKLHGSIFNKTNNLRVFRSSKQPLQKKSGPFQFSGAASSKKQTIQAAKLRIKRKEKRKNLKRNKQDVNRSIKSQKSNQRSAHSKNNKNIR